MALAGGVVGLATLSAMGIPTGWAAQTPKVDGDTINSRESTTDVLVIGEAMAGLIAAVKAHDAGAGGMLVSKERLGSSGQPPFAKGIFAYAPNTAKVSLDEFVDTVSRPALGTNNPVYTRQMAEHSLARVNDLRQWVFFESPLYNKCFSKPIKERNIEVLERIVITHLIKEDGRIAGAAGFGLDAEKIHIFRTKSVILCTGAGGFKPNGFPICDLTHNGTIMAYNIGAKVTGKEWNDGHPGRATNSTACFDGWGGMFERKPTTTSVEVHHDLGVDMNSIAHISGGPIEMPPREVRKILILEGDRTDRPSLIETTLGKKVRERVGAIYTQVGSFLAGSAVKGAVAAEAAAKYCRNAQLQNISKATIAEIETELAKVKME